MEAADGAAIVEAADGASVVEEAHGASVSALLHSDTEGRGPGRPVCVGAATGTGRVEGGHARESCAAIWSMPEKMISA